MFLQEAQLIGRSLAALDVADISPCLNLGSSTRHFREVEQPHIQREVIAPLEARGVRFIHSDIKLSDGVDIVGDVTDPAFQARLADEAPRLVLSTNLLEHIEDRQAYIDGCRAVVPPGGYLLVTVPQSYPIHLDPIDTGFRVTPEQLAALFPEFDCVAAATAEGPGYASRLAAMPLAAWPKFALGSIVKLPWLLATDRQRFLGRYHPYLWLFRPYRTAVVLLRKPD